MLFRWLTFPDPKVQGVYDPWRKSSVPEFLASSEEKMIYHSPGGDLGSHDLFQWASECLASSHAFLVIKQPKVKSNITNNVRAVRADGARVLEYGHSSKESPSHHQSNHAGAGQRN